MIHILLIHLHDSSNIILYFLNHIEHNDLVYERKYVLILNNAFLKSHNGIHISSGQGTKGKRRQGVRIEVIRIIRMKLYNY